VLVAWGFTEQGERVLLAVMRGMRESHEDWLALGHDLIARGLGAPLLVVADGAPGLIKAVATRPRPNASPTTSTRSSCTCAIRPDTAAGGEAPTCSDGRSPRSNAAPR
jgi:hypothetical protein